MLVDYASDHDISPTGVETATRRTFDAWFDELDTAGGTSLGRKPLGEHLLKLKVDPWWVTTLIAEYEKARGIAEKDGGARGYSICVTRTVTATPAQVFVALLDTRHWLGSGSSAEVTQGGAFDDGDGHSGVFKRLTPGKLIRFTWVGRQHQEGEEVEIKLTGNGTRTSIMLNHTRLPNRAAADGMRAAWISVLDKIKERTV